MKNEWYKDSSARSVLTLVEENKRYKDEKLKLKIKWENKTIQREYEKIKWYKD